MASVWRERLRLLLALPGLILAIGLFEKFVLEPRNLAREPQGQLEYWKAFVERHPDFPEGHVTLGQICQDNGDAGCAGRAYARAVQLSRGLQGDVLQRTANPRVDGSAASVDILRTLSDELPNCFICGRTTVSALLAHRQAPEALQRVNTMLERGAADWDSLGGPGAYTQLLVLGGRTYTANGRPRDGLELFGQALVREPDSVEALLQRGALLIEADPPAAVRDLGRAYELRPRDPRLTVGLATAYLNAGQPAQARAVLEPFVARYPNIPRTRALLDRANAELGAGP